MAQQYDADVARKRIRSRLNEITVEISHAVDAIECGASHDYEYRMAEASIESLKVEREKLKEIIGDLPE